MYCRWADEPFRNGVQRSLLPVRTQSDNLKMPHAALMKMQEFVIAYDPGKEAPIAAVRLCECIDEIPAQNNKQRTGLGRLRHRAITSGRAAARMSVGALN